ncbi:MAG: outer membrane protein assembly factor BamD [Calditrichaceae bacterium]
MKLMKLTAVLLLITGITFSCSSIKPEEEYYKSATDAYAKEDFSGAAENFKKLVENYPTGKKYAESLFMLGFINANNLENFKDAEKYYNEFIKKFPEHDLADDARYELDMLGKDINNLPMFQNLDTDTTGQ